MLSTEEECRICFCTKRKENLIQLSCKHFYCPLCIYLWEIRTKTCPTCRKIIIMDPLNDINAHPQIVFVQILQNLKRSSVAVEIFRKFMEKIKEFTVLSKFSTKKKKKLRRQIFLIHQNNFDLICKYHFIFNKQQSHTNYRLTEMNEFSNFLFDRLINMQIVNDYEFVKVLCNLFQVYYFKMILHFGFTFEQYYMYHTYEETILRDIFY